MVLKIDTKFDNEKKKIGTGKQASVFLWDGFAYKVFADDYPKDWIKYEIKIQNVISETGLPVVRYYPIEDQPVIKMDYIDGITLGDRIKIEKYKSGAEDFINLHKKIHLINGINIPGLKQSFQSDIEKADFEDKQKLTAIRYLSEIEDIPALCHLDYHPLNIMYSTEERYYIIDWVDAKLGNPIFDYAKTYVLLYQYASSRTSQKYLTLLKKDSDINLKDFEKAVYINALLRKKVDGYNSDKLEYLLSLNK